MGLPLLLFILLILSITDNAYYANRKVSKEKQAYTDRLKQVNYDYIFLTLGQKTYKAGMIFLLALMAFVIGNDIFKLF